MPEKVSIIIPAYNASSFIERTVASIKAQTFSDWELIIVDDGSTDETTTIIDGLASSDDRITAFHQDNGGEVSARRTGVMNANGDWIMFVDADDIIPDSAISSLLETNVDADIIAGTMRVLNIKEDGTVIEDYVWQNQQTGLLTGHEFSQGILGYKVQMAVWSKLYKRSLFDGFDWCLDRTIKQNPDLLMNIGIGAMAKTVYVTNDAVCYNYMIHQGSVSTSGMMPYDGWRRLFVQAEKYIAKYQHPEQLKDAFLHYQLSCFDGLLRHGEIEFPQNDMYIQQILLDSKNIALNLDEKKVVALMKCRVLRIAFNWWQNRKK